MRGKPPHGEGPRVSDLVIFDCDGVLVDSELIFARILAERLTAIDFPTTIAQAVTLGFGKNRATLSAAVAAQFGRALPDTFFETFAARSATAFEHELMPVPGVEELLATLSRARCVASNGHLDRVRQRRSPACCRSSTPMCSAPFRSLTASRRPICFCSPRSVSVRRRKTA